MQTLRDYQSAGIAKVFALWKQGARTTLMILPTGGGKTTVFVWIAAELARSGVPSLILVHRRELATQACNRLREFGVNYGLIMAGEQAKPYALVQVASVQSLIRRTAPPARLVICDEAHLSTAKSWRQILDQYATAKILGVTATPWRLSGRPLASAYDASTVVATPRELREQGHLCPYVGFSYKTPDLSAIKTTAGDYNEQQSAAAMSDSLIVDNIVDKWLAHARHLSTVVFAVTVEHSQQLTARFKAAGIAAEHLDGGTPKVQRDAILARVASGQTTVLCNVGVAVEGLDIPRLKCCVLARPTKSLARAIQMMGRVRRPWNGVTARIHDHAFTIKLHGLPDDDRDYELSAKPENPPSLTQCPECLALYRGPRCVACDREAAPPELGERVINTIPDAEVFEFDSETPAHAEKPPVEIRWNTPGRTLHGTVLQRWQEETQYGSQWFYRLKGEGREYRFPGTTHLNKLMAKVPDLSPVWITYLGEQSISGGRVWKNFRVEVDDAT